MGDLLETSIIDLIDKYSFLFLNKKNVVGIGLGYKEIKNMITKELCLHVLVKEKVSSKTLYLQDRVPKNFLGIKTDVINVGEVNLENISNNEIISINKDAEKLRMKAKFLQSGYSIGPFFKSAGTLGAIVFDNDNVTKPYILSCNHVLTRGNKGKKGASILQPAVIDGGYYHYNIVGKLYKKIDFIYKKEDEYAENIGDAAIAEFDSRKISYKTDIYKIGKISGISEPKLGKKVQKVGRSTGHTTAVIITTNVVQTLEMEKGLCTFKGLIRTNRLGKGGDSGSLVVDFNNKVIGLLLGGSDRTDYISPIEPTLTYLNIHFNFDN